MIRQHRLGVGLRVDSFGIRQAEQPPRIPLQVIVLHRLVGETEIVDALVRRATRLVFDERLSADPLATVVEAFDRGWKVEVSNDLASAEYLVGLDEIPGLREAAMDLAGEASDAALASAIEFLLEGLHLCNRLNKSATEVGARYHP